MLREMWRGSDYESPGEIAFARVFLVISGAMILGLAGLALAEAFFASIWAGLGIILVAIVLVTLYLFFKWDVERGRRRD